MNIIKYIDNPLRVEDSIDKAMESLNSKCVALYTTVTPQKDSITLKERFNVDICLAGKDTLVIPVTSEIVDLNDTDVLLNEIERIGLDRNKFEI